MGFNALINCAFDVPNMVIKNYEARTTGMIDLQKQAFVKCCRREANRGECFVTIETLA